MRPLASILCFGLASLGVGVSASELNRPPGDVQMPSDVTFVFVGAPAPGLTLDEVSEAVRAGAGEWDGVACSTVEVSAREPVATIDEVPEGTVPIFFVDLDSDCFPERSMGSQSIGFTVWCDTFPSPSILLNAESYTWRSQALPFQSIDQPDEKPVVDLAGVIAHEMGHALLLPHIDDPIATMFARYRRDGSQATLSASDDLELCELYPGGESECSSDADCADGACLTDGVYGACDSFRADTGDFCSWETLQCTEECFFSSPQTGTGYCTESCATDDDCPERMSCRPTSNGSNLCQFEFGEAEPACATGGGALPPVGFWLLGLLTLRTLRRR